MFRLYLYARVRISMCFLHTRPRVQRAPGIPCALFSRGRNSLHTSDAMRRENANTCSIVIIHLVRNCTLERTIQYFRDVND